MPTTPRDITAFGGAAALVVVLFGIAAPATGSTALGVVAGSLGAVSVVVATRLALSRSRVRRERDDALSELRELGVEVEALNALLARPRQQPEDAVDLGRGAFDRVSGLLSERFLAVTLQQRVAAARRRIEPLTLAIFEIDGLEQSTPDEVDRAMAALGETVLSSLRECDIACRLGSALVVSILEATSEHGAVVATERVRGALRRRPGGETLRLSTGIACYPSHALDAPELLARAGRALGLARSTGLDWVATAPEDVHPD